MESGQCRWCEGALSQPESGRPRRWCSVVCRRKAEAARRRRDRMRDKLASRFPLAPGLREQLEADVAVLDEQLGLGDD